MARNEINEPVTTREWSARYEDCKTDEDCWRVYLGAAYGDEEALRRIGDDATSKRFDQGGR